MTVPLLFRYASASARAQMQYPANTILIAWGQFSATVVDVLAIWALFARFGSIGVWRFGDVAMFFGLVSVSFALADFVSRGFDVLGRDFIRTGDLDRLLVRPRSITLQLIGHELLLSRAGRLVQGLAVTAIATRALHFQWTLAATLLAAWTVVGGIALFFGLMVIQGVVSFWTIESLEAMNLLTYGGIQAAQYPLSIYTPAFRDFLIFVVPVGCVAYFPVLALLGKADPLGAPAWLLPLTPSAGFVFLGAAFALWRVGLRKYMSTGS